jgi:hypothetical protein
MIQIDTTSRIVINGKPTGLAVRQAIHGSIVYKAETAFTPYAEVKLPKNRYTLSTEQGQAEFERDILSVLQ